MVSIPALVLAVLATSSTPDLRAEQGLDPHPQAGDRKSVV